MILSLKNILVSGHIKKPYVRDSMCRFPVTGVGQQTTFPGALLFFLGLYLTYDHTVSKANDKEVIVDFYYELRIHRVPTIFNN